MTTTATHNAHDTTPGRALFVAFELSAKRGKNIAFLSTICVDEALRFFPQLDRLPAVRRFLFHYCGNP
jgi:hypothetical protein